MTTPITRFTQGPVVVREAGPGCYRVYSRGNYIDEFGTLLEAVNIATLVAAEEETWRPQP